MDLVDVVDILNMHKELPTKLFRSAQEGTIGEAGGISKA